VLSTPAPPTVTPASATITAGDAISFTASGDPGAIFNVYDAATGGNLLFTGATYSGNGPCISTIFYVEQNNGSCSSSRTPVTITVNPIPDPVTASASRCGSGVVNLSASGAYTLNWYTAATGGTLVNTGTTYNPNVSITTVYYVENAHGGCINASGRIPVTVTVNTAPSASASVSPTAVCPGDQVTLTGSGNLPTSGYTMNGSCNTSFIDISSTGTLIASAPSDDSQFDITFPSAFTYNGTPYTGGRVSNNGWMAFGINTGISGGFSNVCLPTTSTSFNTSTGDVLCPYWDDLYPPPAANSSIMTQQIGSVFIIQWTNEDHISVDLGNTISFQIQLNMSTGVVTFVYQDVSFGNVTYDNGINATVGLNFNSGGANQYSCLTASLITGQCISFTPNSSTVSYLWTASPSATINNATTTNATANPMAATTYTLAVSGGGCTTTATTTQVTMNSAPVTIAASPAGVCHNGSVITLSSNFDGPYASYSGIGVSGNIFDPSAPGVVDGNNPVTVTYTPPTGCSGSATMNINVFPLPNPAVTNSGPVCEGSAFELSAASGLSNYVWTGPNGFTYSGHDTIIDVSSLAMAGVYTVTVTEGTHGCVNTGTTTQVIYQNPTVTATVDPTLVCPNGSATFTGSAIFYDGSDLSQYFYGWFGPGGFSSDFGLLLNPVSVSDEGDYTFFAYDSRFCNSSVVVHLSVGDVTPPTIVSIPGNVTVQCASDVPAFNDGAVVATDNCTAPLVVTHSQVTTNLGCPNHFTVSRTYTVTDAYGNNTSRTQTITVHDTTPPTLVHIPADFTVDCAGDIPVNIYNVVVSATYTGGNNVFVSDNCAGDLTVTTQDVTNPGGCVNHFTVSRIWTVTDVCGNHSSQTQTITVNDQTAPVLSGCPGNITLSACAADPTWTITATDNCPLGAVTVTHTTFPTHFANGTTTTVTYTATDACGNHSSCSFTVTRKAALVVNPGPNVETFFGYTTTQSLTRTATVTGGQSPYTWTHTLNRGLLCNQANGNGDESFTGGVCTNNTCTGTAPYQNVTPPSCTGPLVTMTLLDTGIVCFTVTDADGCTATGCFTDYAQDARCFSGGGNTKVIICHHTGSGWIQICVDSNAVSALLAQGDLIGTCHSNGHKPADEVAPSLLTAYPNPFTDKTTIAFSVPKDGNAVIRVFDALGKQIGVLFDGIATAGTLYKVDFDGARYAEGMYFYSITSDEMNQTKKMQLIK
jgi:hypothetical protein